MTPGRRPHSQSRAAPRLEHGRDHRLAGAGPRRVEHDQIGREVERRRRSRRVTLARRTSAQPTSARLASASATACASDSMPTTRPPGPTARARTEGEQPGAGVRDRAPTPPAAASRSRSSGLDERLRGGRVHLPEAAGRDLEVDRLTVERADDVMESTRTLHQPRAPNRSGSPAPRPPRRGRAGGPGAGSGPAR